MSVPLDPAGTETLVSRLGEPEQMIVRGVLDWLLPEEGGLVDLTQSTLQDFLWYHLPVKWLIGTREHHEVAWALADLLTAAGLDRYAGLCRSTDTHQLIETWQVDRPKARRTLKRLGDSSGVEPLDTDLVVWGDVFGIAEADARSAASEALEAAIDAGSLVPGAPRWKAEAARVADASLQGGDSGGSGTRLERLRAERAQTWAGRAGTRRVGFLEPVVALLPREVGVPPDAAASLEPLMWLLRHVGDGVTMTQAGYLPKALVVAANTAFGWFDLPGCSVRTEHDVPELALLHELARGARLLTKRGRRLTLSASGQRSLDDPDLLWHNVIHYMFDGARFEGDGAGLYAACLLENDEPQDRQAIQTQVGDVVREKWQAGSGESLGQHAGLLATRDVQLLGRVFGWSVADGSPMAPRIRLTDTGREAAWLGLQTQAWGPRSRP